MSIAVTDEIYQIVTPEGQVVGALPNLPDDTMLGLYRWMLVGRTYSDKMVALQRQGRMGTFAPVNGQEATSVGIAAPLQAEDWLVASYRENLSYLVKGAPALALMKQWGGDVADNYPPEVHCLPFQIVLGSQMLHAVGVAQAIQYTKSSQVVLAACGDGATSEGDFSEALNFAGVFKAPVIFVIQNNGWAISTPYQKQTAAQRLAHRASGFGLPGRVVDGNDLLAVYQVVSEAIERARAGAGPTLIEAITYRLGAHTTADDPTRYRTEAEVQEWSRRDPLLRFRHFLMEHQLLTELEDKRLRKEIAVEIQAAVDTYETLPTSSPSRLFDLVYAQPSPQLKRQREEMFPNLEEQEPEETRVPALASALRNAA